MAAGRASFFTFLFHSVAYSNELLEADKCNLMCGYIVNIPTSCVLTFISQQLYRPLRCEYVKWLLTVLT